jgi:hypothetical protein
MKYVPRVLAALYLAWSLFIFFGSLGGEGHSWWPAWLYFLIWPWGWLEHALLGLMALLTSGLGAVPNWAYTTYDYLAGA